MLLSILYIIGITAEGMTGALAAGREKMDIFGVIIIASVTAIGGGSVRDVLLGHYPLGWVKRGGNYRICCTIHQSFYALLSHYFLGARCDGFSGVFHYWCTNCNGYGT